MLASCSICASCSSAFSSRSRRGLRGSSEGTRLAYYLWVRGTWGTWPIKIDKELMWAPLKWEVCACLLLLWGKVLRQRGISRGTHPQCREYSQLAGAGKGDKLQAQQVTTEFLTWLLFCSFSPMLLQTISRDNFSHILCPVFWIHKDDSDSQHSAHFCYPLKTLP